MEGRPRYRPITDGDMEAIFRVRVATRENAYTLSELEALGITPKSVIAMMRDTHRGWLCEVDGQAVGFAMGDRRLGEMWVIAVLPQYEGQGIGGRLLTLVEDWLWDEGWKSIWLTTDVDTSLRAYGFYLRQGWQDRNLRDGLRYMEKHVR